MRLKTIDNYLIGLMALFALLALYNLYGVKFINASKEDSVEIASIIEQNKIVKRKKDFYQSWVDADPGDGLSANEQIYTHGQSSAKIQFIGGPLVTLFENSLLRIKGTIKDRSLSLDKGNLNATLSKEAPKLNVQLNGKTYTFESDKANIQIEQGEKENKFMLLDGKAKLNIDQKNQEIRANEVLVQDKASGSLKINVLPFKILSPKSDEHLYFNKSSSVTFKWSYLKEDMKNARIVVSASSLFDSPVIDQTVDGEEVTLPLNEEGQYYWKLISPEGTSGPLRSFTFSQERPLTLNSDKEIVYKGPKKNEKVVLTWNADSKNKYLVKTKDPKGDEQELLTDKSFIEVPLSSIGTYGFTVKVADEKRPEAIPSPEFKVEVIEARAIEIKSSMPETLEKISYKDEPLNVLLSWQGPENGVNYKIKLEHDKLGTTELSSMTNSLVLNLKDPGHYRWSLKGENDSGVSTNLISGNIIIKAPRNVSATPAEGTVIELDRPDQLVNFKWDQIEKSAEYNFEIAEDKGFKEVLYEAETKNNTISTALAKTGKYYWRVKVKSGNETIYSAPVSVEIRPTPPLSGPSELPKIKIKLKYQGEKDTTSFFELLKNIFISEARASDIVPTAEWDIPANSRAKLYIVEIYQDSDLTKLLAKIISEKPHIVWKNAQAGTFYWRMSYEDFWGRHTEFSKVSTLSTEDDEEFIHALELKKMAEVPLELSSPKHKEDILDSIDDTATFNWGAIAQTENYQFLVDTDLEFVHPILNLKVKTNTVTLNCKNFKNSEGDYYWKVIGSLGNTSKRRQFHVRCEKNAELPTTPSPTPSPLPQLAQLAPTPPLKADHFLSAGLAPHKLTYKNKAAAYESKISGTVLDSVFAEYHRPADLKYFEAILLKLWIQRGKVFESITFTDLELDLKLEKKAPSFLWGPMVSFMKKTLYIESNSTISASSKSNPLIGLFIQKEINQLRLNAEVKALGATSLKVMADYAIKEKYRLGVFFGSTSIKEGSDKHGFSEAGLTFSYNFLFPKSGQ